MKPYVAWRLVFGVSAAFWLVVVVAVMSLSGCDNTVHGPLYYGNLSRMCDLGDKAACDALKDLNAKYQRRIANKP